jgi:transcription initiation factor IIE alpha subunit
LDLLNNKLKREIGGLQQKLKSRETKMFYVCKTCKTEVSEETALLHDFICQECGEVYELNEDKRFINQLRNEISKLKRQRINVLEELKKVREAKQRKMARKERKPRKKMKKKAAKKKAVKKVGKVKKKKSIKRIKKIVEKVKSSMKKKIKKKVKEKKK